MPDHIVRDPALPQRVRWLTPALVGVAHAVGTIPLALFVPSGIGFKVFDTVMSAAASVLIAGWVYYFGIGMFERGHAHGIRETTALWFSADRRGPHN